MREDILALEGPGVNVGPPTMRYSYLMGNSRFCLVPRGRGWWDPFLGGSFSCDLDRSSIVRSEFC